MERTFDRSQFRGTLILFTIVMGVLLLVFMLLAATTWTSLKPWEVGVKQARFLGEGYYEGYTGGNTYLMWPIRDRMIRIPTNLRYISIHAQRARDGSIVEGTGLVVPTTDGQKVASDISIVYRIFDKAELPPEAADQQPAEQGAAVQANAEVVVNVEAKAQENKDLDVSAQDAKKIEYHGGPLQLISQLGVSPENWDQRVQQIAEDGTRRALGHLTTDDYYNSQKREQMCYLAQKMLNQGWKDERGVYVGLHAYGMHCEAVLVRAYAFPKVIDDAIFNKVTQVQRAILNRAKEEEEKQNALVTKVEAEGKANVDVKLIEGESQVVRIDSEADLYEKTKKAEGDLLVETAEAKVIELKSQAFEMKGGDLYVARQLKDLPTKVSGGILTGFNPLEMKTWLDMVAAPAPTSPTIQASSRPSPAPTPPVPDAPVPATTPVQ